MVGTIETLVAETLPENNPTGAQLPEHGRDEHATDELFARSPAASLQFLRPMISFGVFYSCAVTPIMLFVLARTWDAGACGALRSWVALHFGLQSVQLPFRVLLLKDLRCISWLPEHQAAHRLLRLSRSMLWCARAPGEPCLRYATPLAGICAQLWCDQRPS